MNLLSRDFFTDPELMHDPAPFYRAQHEQGPIFQEAFHDVFTVSGLEEVLSIYGDHASFSAVVAPFGPFVSLPERAPGENVREMLERGRGSVGGQATPRGARIWNSKRLSIC